MTTGVGRDATGVTIPADPAAYRQARSDLLDRPLFGSRAARRRALTALTDEWLGAVFAASGLISCGATLVAVGGYGRGELAPGSDLDLLLLLPDPEPDAEVIDRLWYPVWDTGVPVDHSVRTVAQARRLAQQDLRVVLGLLDARVVVGDPGPADALRSSVLADWRGLAHTRLAELHHAITERRARSGELAHLLEPDLKDSYGGLRDLTIMNAVAASWLTDVPREGLRAAGAVLLDTRDALHEVQRSARRPGDRLLLQEQDAVAARIGHGDADALLREVSLAGRAVAYASDGTWHRVMRLTRTQGPAKRRLRRAGPERVPLADGVVIHEGEAALAADARPDRDPVLPLRAAAAAAQAGLPLALGTVERLEREAAPMPVPWPSEARDALVSLLGAGPGLVPVWEALDQADVITRLIPGWEVVRSAPQRNPLHTFTVDRHLVETAAAAAPFVRDVDRPDLLLVGALLHDIGKGRPGDHTENGVAIVADLAPHLGFDQADSATLVALVRHHLLLPDTATRRDLDDPLTIDTVARAVGDQRTLDLLDALTRADAQATGPAAWSEWKAGLIDTLVDRVSATLGGQPPVPAPRIEGRHAVAVDDVGVVVTMEPGERASTIVVASDDRLGLLGTVAGVLALHRLEVRSADTESTQTPRGTRALTVWTVTPLFGDPPTVERLRADIRLALDGDLDVAGRLRERAAAAHRPHLRVAPRVEILTDASSRADVLEVRAHDEPGLLHRLGLAIASTGASIVGARVSTLGSEAVDVFYLVRPDGARLTPDHLAAVRTTVLAELTRPDPG